MKKRIFSVVLFIVTLFSFVACSGGGDGSSGSEKNDGSDMPKGYYDTAVLGDSLTDKGVYKELVTVHYTDYLYEHCPFIENIQNVGYAGSCIAGLSDKQGKTSPSFIERYSKIKKDANLIIVFGGTNDYGIGSSTLPNPLGEYGDDNAATFYGGLKTLIDGLEKNYPAAKLVFVTPIYRKEQEITGIPNKNKYGFTLEDYVSAIKETCEKRGVSCIDAFSGLSEINADTYEKYEIDGLHLNDEGNLLLGKYLAAELAKILD